jgi:hypothetical protein
VYGLGVAKEIQIRTQLLERIGEEKNPDADQKEPARNGDDPHISFDSVKGSEE